MKLTSTIAIVAAAVIGLSDAHKANLRNIDDARRALADTVPKLVKASEITADAHDRLLEGDSGGLNGVTDALDAIDKSIDIFNKISDIVIDKKAVEAAEKYLTENSAKMLEYGSKETITALEDLAALSTTQLQTGERVKTMANTLKANAKNVKLLFSKVDISTGQLDDTSKKMLAASLTLLAKTLESAADQCEEARKVFESVQLGGAKLQATMSGIVLYFEKAAKDGSDVIKAAIEKVRMQAYITCGAVCALSAFFPPNCVACYAPAAAIVEGKFVPELQKELNQYKNMLDEFATSFNVYKNLAKQFTDVARISVQAIGNYTTIIVAAKNFVQSTQDIDVAIILIDEYNTKLDEIIEGTDELLDKIPSA